MSVLNNSLLLGADAASGYTISRSLRFNSADSAYLSRTPASAGNRKTWTWAGWVKRSNSDSSNAEVFGAGSNNLSLSLIGDNINVYEYNGSSTLWQRSTTAVYRDFSAWYHVVLAYDTTQATASNRIRLYINGAEVTQFSTNTNPTLNFDGYVNNNIVHYICYQSISGRYFNGYLADIHFIDGQALDPTSFGEFSVTTGVWMPKAYTGTYGTNGFKLNFSDNSTAAALGTDSSGAGNTWTVNNLSVTAGAGNDSLVDVPVNGSQTDTGAGGEVRGNYPTWNPLAPGANATFANGNLDLTISPPSTAEGRIGNFYFPSGKWYWEMTVTVVSSEYPHVGLTPRNNLVGANVDSDSTGYCIRMTGKIDALASSNQTYGTSYATGDIVMFAFDVDAGKLWYGKNGTWQASGNPASGTNPSSSSISTTTPYTFAASGFGGPVAVLNMGQRPFAYTAPSGFKALCTANLPAGTITTSGTFTGNANAEGPFVYLNGVPTAMTINGNAVTFATHADKLSNGFKVRTSSGSYNTAGSNTYSVSTTGANFKNARAQSNP